MDMWKELTAERIAWAKVPRQEGALLVQETDCRLVHLMQEGDRLG